MGLGSIIGAVAGPVLGGILGGSASNKAANAQEQANAQAIAEQRRQYDAMLNIRAPEVNTGNAARSMLASILGLSVPGSTYNFGSTSGTTAQPAGGGGIAGVVNRAKANNPATNTGGVEFISPAASPMSGDDINARLESFPGFKFAVDQARKQALAAGSATGGIGGNVLSALSRDTAGSIAMPVFNSYLDRLAGLSGAGQAGSNAVTLASQNNANNVSRLLQDSGVSRASGIMGQAGAGIGALGGILGGLGQSAGTGNIGALTPFNGNPYAGVPFRP